jgi:hypothetical protein
MTSAAETKPGGDAHLRSAKEVTGYQLQAKDGPVGTIHSFIVDEQNWLITELIIKRGRWPLAKEFRLMPANISRISHADSTVLSDFFADDLMLTTETNVVQRATD